MDDITMPDEGEYQNGYQWWGDDDTLIVTVAEHAVDGSMMTTARELLDYLEKPWNYAEHYEHWRRFGDGVPDRLRVTARGHLEVVR